MTDSEGPLILDAIFHELRTRGVPVGIRDYCDAVRALRGGFGFGNRHNLRLLCHALWARTDEDRRLVDMVFEMIEPPSAEDDAAIPHSLSSSGGGDAVLPVPSPTPDASLQPSAGVDFADRNEPGDVPLPRLEIGTLSLGETFIVEPQSPVPERFLSILWRRLRVPSRISRKTGREVDVAATISAFCRQGVLGQLVHRPERENTARLLVLADASPSMAPWSPLLNALVGSLAHGRLKTSELLYFSNRPRRSLFRTRNLTDPVPMTSVVRDHAGSALLIFSDAGAARGAFDRRRLEATVAFLRRDCANHQLRPIVWLNPVPRTLWAETTAGKLARLGNALMLPIDDASLIQAIDVLRGTKSA